MSAGLLMAWSLTWRVLAPHARAVCILDSSKTRRALEEMEQDLPIDAEELHSPLHPELGPDIPGH